MSDNDAVMSIKTRWLIIVTGTFLLGSVFLGWGSLVEAGCLIVGASVQPRSRRLGRWLIWISALSINAIYLPSGIKMLLEGIKSALFYHNAALSGISLLLCLSVLLTISSDVALVLDATLTKNYDARRQTPPRQLDWIVRIAGSVLNAYYVWMSAVVVRSYKLQGNNSYMLIAVLAVASLILLFDIALIIETVKRRANFAE